MIPTNVMSFVKKMVTTTPESGSSAAAPEDGGRTFSKLRQIGSDLMTATGNVTKLAPAKVTPVESVQPKETTPVIEPPKAKTEQEKAANRAAACRVCIKSIKPEDFSRTCNECQRKVCEDCASYSATADSDDTTWRCSVCRRKLAPRDTPAIANESTDGSLEVPLPENLVRRHSDVRPTAQAVGGGPTSVLGAGLVPPRTPDLRRHSDVSPASLKDLEKFRKVAGERARGGGASDDWEWRSKSRSGSPDRHQERDRDRGGGGGDRQRGSSPQRKISDQDNDVMDEEEERRHRSRRAAQGASTVRRKSRVTRQHSYDDEIKNAQLAASGGGHSGHTGGDTGLGLPVQLARRASAYDVYSPGGGASLAAIVPPQHRSSISAQGTREPEVSAAATATVPVVAPTARRPSFRANKPVMPYEPAAADDDLDATPAPDPDVLMPDEEMRSRRRGSQLPNINAIRALATAAQQQQVMPRPGPPAVARVNVDDRELARQGSLADGEGIKIVIHDVDDCEKPRANAKKKIILRKDIVVEKGHRTRSFGMRVVGGKTGADQRLYAVVVWTVSGGPADKAGMQKGDKVLEWGGVSLIDREFEEVAHIIDRSGDVAELIVEHATDMSGDPGMDEPAPVEKAPGNLGLGQLESETNKAPSSPTRRKLPKTPV